MYQPHVINMVSTKKIEENNSFFADCHSEEDGTPPEPIPAWDKQDERSPDDVISWIEFTENTTFHGVKYIFDDKPYRIRR